jgi:hypothetical protein
MGRLIVLCMSFGSFAQTGRTMKLEQPKPSAAELLISPAAVSLDGPEAVQQLLVRASKGSTDFTRKATYEIVDPKIATVDAAGLVLAKAEGRTHLVVRHGKDQVRIAVEVVGIKGPKPVSFETQIMPILTKAGCNAGACHGKAEGKNGFKLSVFGHDPDADYQSLAMDARGRRIFAANPEFSLLLRKPTGQISHGGGKKINKDSLQFKRLLRWITEGAHSDGKTCVKGIEVEPRDLTLGMKSSQQVRVTAIDTAGKRRCVTLEADFGSNAPAIARVDGRGWIQTGNIAGGAAILVRHLGHVAICRIIVPKPRVRFTRPPEVNFIDRLAWDNLVRLGIPPSDLADDATFLRRVYLDTIGTLPTAAEARAFLADKSQNKRDNLIVQLLKRPEYADYWAMRWSDLLRVDRDVITPAGAVAMTRWLRKQFADNTPIDEYARAIVTAKGNTAGEGPAAIYKALATPEEMSRSFSQLFLGVRIACAQCHHHPSERWGQDDYYALAGFFTGVGRKTLPGGFDAIFVQKGLELKHPRTGKPLPARALGAAPVDLSKIPDRRTVLAQWLTKADNPFFARAIANRLWAHYFGRGLVEPLDDLRATNPSTNEPLLDELAKHLRAVKYDVRAFTRTLLNSRLYQLSSRPTAANASDEQNFSHAKPKAIPAEVLLDAISQATGSPEKFNGWPNGYRAIQIWDNRMPSYFFRIFGRPVRASVCECERSNEPSIAQALHLMNSDEIMDKVRARKGTARKLALSAKKPAEIIEDLYLGTLSRFPTDKEKALMLRVFAESEEGRQAAVEDVLWALLNTRGFVYNH